MDYTFLGFLFYLFLVLVVGVFTYRRNKDHSDYFLAGRKLNPWIVAFSERASGESAWLILGLPGAAMASGLIEVWTALGCVLGIIFYWSFIGKDLREKTERSGSITISDFVAKSFPENETLLRLASSVIILFFFTFYLAAQFNGAGKVLEVTFGIPASSGMIIGAAVIVIYTMLGGFLAVAITDFIQGLLMVGALVVLPIVAIVELNSRGISLFSAIGEESANLSSLTGGAEGMAAAALIIGGLSWGLGYMGQPHLLTRFMSINDPENIRIGRKIAIWWAIPAFSGAILLGLAGMAMYGHGYFSDPEQVMPFMANSILPSWIAGVFISAAIAAMMSTADSQLLVVSSTIIEDIYHKILSREVTQKKLLLMSRLSTLFTGVAAFLIAITSQELIFALVSYAWSGLGASFGPIILLRLKWKKMTANGALAGMLTGFLTTIIWHDIDYLNAIISARFVSFIAAFIAIIIVFRLSRN